MTTMATVLRGLRSRGMLSVASLAMMVLAVSGAVLGPMFQQAATGSYTLTRIDDSADPLTALTWRAEARQKGDLDDLVTAAVAEAERLSPEPYAAPEVTLVTTPLIRSRDFADITYLSRDDVCSALEVEGRCPERPGEVLVNEDDLGASEVGDTVDLPALGRPEIVGVYATPETSDFFLLPTRLASRPAGPRGVYTPGPYIVAPGVIGTLPPRFWVVQLESRLEVPERISDAGFDDLVAATERLRDATSTIDGGVLIGNAEVNDLSNVLDDVRAQREAARAAVTPAVLALVLIALAMILRLQIAAADLRGPELALAALRGVGSRRAWVLGLSEPWFLVLLSLPLGLVGGYAATSALARAGLRPGLEIGLPTGSVVGALLVAAAMAGVSALAVGQGMRETLGSRLTGVRRPGRSPRAVLLAELVVVLLAAALPLTRLGADAGGLGLADLLLPVATAIAAGLITTRVVAAAATWWTGRGAERPLSVFVAARAVARRTQGTLVILPVAAAIAVSVFAVGVDSVASGWRSSLADTTAPGDEVYESPLLLDETLHLTRRLDPDGRWLMTAAQVAAPETDPIVLLDASRLERVGAWSPQWLDGASAAEAAALLTPRPSLVDVTGTRIGLTVESPTRGASVELEVRTADGVRTVSIGPFPAGTSTRSTRSDLCTPGCAVQSVSVVDADEAVRVSGLSVDDAAVVPDLTSPGWTTAPADDATPPVPARTDGDVLVLEPDTDLVPAVVSAPLAMIAGVGTDVGAGGTAIEIAQEEIDVSVVGRAESLPYLGPAGVLLDLPSFLARYNPPAPLVGTTVLVRDDAPRSVVDGLTGAGLTRTIGAEETRRALDTSAYAQALRLYLVVAAALLVMALGGLVVSSAVQMPARRRDAASLRVVGVTRRTVAAASWWESFVVLGAAAVAGLAAGALALAVLLPSLTLGLVDEVVTPRVLPDPDVARLVLFAGAVAAVLLLVSVSTSLAVVRRARASTLRENA